MKIDKRNFRHWLLLLRVAVAIGVTMPLRFVYKRRKRKVVILYGHKLNGNIAAFSGYLSQSTQTFDVYFLTMDPAYYAELKELGVKVLLAVRIKDMAKVAQSSVIITDHGPHILTPYMYVTRIKFVDVWHGVPFKGFVPENFKYIRKFAETWVTSPQLKKVYSNQLGFIPERVKVTGYARVDTLLNMAKKKMAILQKYELHTFKKIVLIAPTWKQDDKGRSIVPFGLTEDGFFAGLNDLAKSIDSLVVFRAHLNASKNIKATDYSNIKFMPYSKFPLAEEFLAIADVLVTDWSSICFDYLPLKRPTIFLGVKPPFKNGFTVGPEHRFGEVVDTYEDLLSNIKKYTLSPDKFIKEHKSQIKETSEYIYGDTLDGKATQRYAEQLSSLIG